MVLDDFVEAGGPGAPAATDGAGRESRGESGDATWWVRTESLSGSPPAGWACGRMRHASWLR
mgnify:FL=1